MQDELASRVRKLARLVSEARDLAEVDRWFHSALVSLPTFHSESEPATHRPLVAVARGVARAYGVSVELVDPLRRIPRLHFWHGALVGPGEAMAIIVYFDDQHCGVCSFGNLEDPNTHYARLTLPEELRDPDLDVGEVGLTSIGQRGPRGVA